MIRVAQSVWCGLLILGVLPVASRAAEPAKIDYIRHIQPILSNKCFACHGPDEGQRQSGLRLDRRDSAVAAADSGAVAIVPGDAANSELLKRILSDDPDVQMPPADANKQLTAEEKQLLKQWVESGAEYRGHWSYQPITRPAVPEGEASADVAIDRFVRQGMEATGLEPASEADRRTLIRRLSFDLRGLPPSPEEVDEFLADTSPEAYAKLIDRLLASPHYGERMAHFWLDLVRFADSAGYHSDNHRDLTPYRDYVITSFNENKPFDQFTIEQLAGDLLPGATDEQRVASGYNRALMTTGEGGAQAKEYAAKYSADRVRNVSTVWLGATLGCAECHDHKFDPFTAKDFYSMAAFFADIQELPVGLQPQTSVPTREQRTQLTQLEQQLAGLRTQLAQDTPELQAAQGEWEKTALQQTTEWQTLRPTEALSAGGATLTIQEDGSVLASGTAPERDTYTLTFKTSLAGISGLRFEALPHDSLPGRGPGRAGNGNLVLSELQAKLNEAPITWGEITASHHQELHPPATVADGKPESGWALLPNVGQASELVLETAGAFGDGAEATLVVTILQNHENGHTIGHFRLAATNSPRPIRVGGGLPAPIQEVLAIEATQRTDEQRAALATYYRTIAPALDPVRQEVTRLEQQHAAVMAAAPKTLVSMSGPPREIRILPRGNWQDDSGPVVMPAVPAFLPAMTIEGERATRLDLARWLTKRDNPLVARVLVNRLWAMMYGQGLAKPLDDVGAQGALPSHPELLDYLAADLVDSGWDIKRLIKLMALSQTYRQRSDVPRQMRELDPANTYLARQARFRLDAEFVRDNALAISGLLRPTIGGPSVKPYQPAGYWSFLNFPTRDWAADTGDNQWRRGLYTYWQRTFLHPSLLAFDAPTREECTAERPRSNTPLQALVLLNDPTYVEAARVLAQRMCEQGGGSLEDRVQYAYRRAVARPARADEVAVLAKVFESHRQQYAADPAAAAALLQTGQAPQAANLDPAEHAAMTSVARIILNLHETITRN